MFSNDALYSFVNVVEREDITGLQENDKKVVHYFFTTWHDIRDTY